MKKPFFLCAYIILALSLLLPGSAEAQAPDYRSPDKVIAWMKQIENRYPDAVSTTTIASSPGERPVSLIKIGKDLQSDKSENPSVFVGANLEGTRPLATEGAIFLTETILSDPSNYDSLNWYIVPLGNPDAAARYFSTPLMEDGRNDHPVNDDLDEQTDEDGVNDLNGDGFITKMRVIHPDGDWIISEKDPRLMQKADPEKGEQGVYKLFSEGIDDDGDGKYNEDGQGGTNVEINFPQLFKHYTADGGSFPGSSPESYAIMKFVFEHPDIAMIVSLGSTNWCHTPPKGGRKGEADLSKIRLSERQARRFNLDQTRTYTIGELVEIFRAENPQEQVDEGVIAGYLGLGAALNPQEGDLLFYKKYASAYQSYLKEKGVERERTGPEPAPDGSFELWAYFQVGVPVFSLDLWALDKKDSASLEELMMAHIDSHPDNKGFVEWEPYEHPTLGTVEIGGFIPYLASTPPYEWTDSLLNLQIPWILELAGEIPRLHIYETKIGPKGNGIYQLDIWIENRSFIPFPTAMGSRNRQPAPAVLLVEGEEMEFISGYRRTPIRRVGGKSRIKTSLIIQKEKPGDIILKLESKTAGQDLLTIKIGG